MRRFKRSSQNKIQSLAADAIQKYDKAAVREDAYKKEHIASDWVYTNIKTGEKVVISQLNEDWIEKVAEFENANIILYD